MKPTKMRNQQLYRASLRTRSNQLGSPLSEDLRKKYGRRSIRAAKGDTVRVMRGEYKGVDGKVVKVSTEKCSVAIEGIKKEKSKGEKFDVYIHCSNVMVISLNTEDHWRKSTLEGKPPKTTPKETKEEAPKEPEPEKPEVEVEKTDMQEMVKADQPTEAKAEKPEEAKTEKPKKVTTSKPEKAKGDKLEKDKSKPTKKEDNI